MQLWLDCDGVLADFNTGFEREFNQPPSIAEREWGASRFWAEIARSDRFFERLPVMPDALDLYLAVKHIRPIILTGTPIGDWAVTQKLRWRDKHFPGVPMVTCLTRNKRLYCQPGDVLVDDREKNTEAWTAARGVFILHRSAQSSILELQTRGVIR